MKPNDKQQVIKNEKELSLSQNAIAPYTLSYLAESEKINLNKKNNFNVSELNESNTCKEALEAYNNSEHTENQHLKDKKINNYLEFNLQTSYSSSPDKFKLIISEEMQKVKVHLKGKNDFTNNENNISIVHSKDDGFSENKVKNYKEKNTQDLHIARVEEIFIKQETSSKNFPHDFSNELKYQACLSDDSLSNNYFKNLYFLDQMNNSYRNFANNNINNNCLDYLNQNNLNSNANQVFETCLNQSLFNQNYLIGQNNLLNYSINNPPNQYNNLFSNAQNFNINNQYQQSNLYNLNNNINNKNQISLHTLSWPFYNLIENKKQTPLENLQMNNFLTNSELKSPSDKEMLIKLQNLEIQKLGLENEILKKKYLDEFMKSKNL